MRCSEGSRTGSGSIGCACLSATEQHLLPGQPLPCVPRNKSRLLWSTLTFLSWSNLKQIFRGSVAKAKPQGIKNELIRYYFTFFSAAGKGNHSISVVFSYCLFPLLVSFLYLSGYLSSYKISRAFIIRMESPPPRKGQKRRQRPTCAQTNHPLKRHLSSNTALTERRVLIRALVTLQKQDQNPEIPFFEEPLVKSHTLQDYILDRPLGRGAEGSVFLAHHIDTGKPVAVKLIDKGTPTPRKTSRTKDRSHWKPRYKLHRNSVDRKATEDARYRIESGATAVNLSVKRAKTEIFVMRRLQHRHVVPLLHAWEDPLRICLIMAYATGGDLFEHIQKKGRPEKRETWRIFKELLSAVQHMHSRGFVHRDLKPENIFLTEEREVLLGDFGFSAHWNSLVKKKEEHVVGSMPYVAPEVLLGKDYTGPEIDIWSLGVILYEILSGGLPFEGKTPRRMFKSITTAELKRCPEFTDLEFDLLSRMLTKDSVKRASIMDIIQHPWVQAGPKKKNYHPLPNSLRQQVESDSCDSDECEEAEEEEEDEYRMGTTRRVKWRRTPLTVIVEDSEITEYS